ncbi:hypothetical protein NEH59_21920, partial [Xanthomonas hortorum pv. pelargonii]|nr:hypothetical protein [Xanthomonas hortorum pv. pelargonii]
RGHRTRQLVGCFVENMHTDHLHWSLPGHWRRVMRKRSSPGVDYPVAGPAYPAPDRLVKKPG